MSRKNRNLSVAVAPAEAVVLEGLAAELAVNPELSAAYDAALAETPVEPPVADVAVEVPAGAKRAPFAVAKERNFANAVTDPENATGAKVVKPLPKTNLERRRVYGYDNGTGGGGVPKEAKVVVVDTSRVPKGVKADEWAKVREMAGKTVSSMYDGGVSGSAIRRSYRAGAIRFVAA